MSKVSLLRQDLSFIQKEKKKKKFIRVGQLPQQYNENEGDIFLFPTLDQKILMTLITRRQESEKYICFLFTMT